MNMWSKMLTALKGGVNEAGEAVVDSQALRILDQELREASGELQQSKAALADMLARQKLAEQKVAALKKQIDEHEGYAIKALEQDNEALAIEVAEKIADLEGQQQLETNACESLKTQVIKLRQTIAQTEQGLKRLQHQVDTVKATESVQRAQAAVAERYSGADSKMRTAMDSLERIKEKQAFKDAQMQAASELAADNNEASLQEKLEAAGIVSGSAKAADILERLKNKS